MPNYDCWLHILEFLDLKGLYNVLQTNCEMKDMVVDYIKRNRVIDCKGREDYFHCLLDKGYRVILGKNPWQGRVHTLILNSCRIITDVSALERDTPVQRMRGRRQRRKPAFRYRGRLRKPNRRRQRIFQLHQRESGSPLEQNPPVRRLPHYNDNQEAKRNPSVKWLRARTQRRKAAPRYRGRPRKPNRRRQRIFQLHQPGRG